MVRCFLLLVLLVPLTGCGSGVYPVRGKVLFEGKPMTGGGAISFVPLEARPGPTAGGLIAEDGSFTLTTTRPGDGSKPGEFRVVIHQVTVTEPERTEDGQRPASPTAVVPLALRIPKEYSDPINSPLRAVVEAKDPNDLVLELKRLK